MFHFLLEANYWAGFLTGVVAISFLWIGVIENLLKRIGVSGVRQIKSPVCGDQNEEEVIEPRF